MLKFVEAECEAVEEADGLGDRLGASANSRAISRGDLRWRSALACVRSPAASSVVVSRMQASTSASARRSGACMSASLVAISGALNGARERNPPRERAAHVRAIGEARADPQALAEGLAQEGDGRALTPTLSR